MIAQTHSVLLHLKKKKKVQEAQHSSVYKTSVTLGILLIILIA